MHKSAQTIPNEFVVLRNAITGFYQNMKIAYNKMKDATEQNVLAAYKPLLENIAAASSLGTTFTTDQMRQHLRYIEGTVKKLASVNATEQEPFLITHGRQSYYAELNKFGDEIMEIFVPLATLIKSNLQDIDLIAAAPALSDTLNKTGANFVTHLNARFNKQASRADSIMKMADVFVRRLNLHR